MAYPDPPPHLRITWSGILGSVGSPAEIWSFGLNAGGPIGEGWLAQTPEAYATLAATMQAQWAGRQSQMSSAVTLTRTRVASIGLDGLVRRTPEGAYAQGDSITASTGSGSHFGQPPQMAAAVSLRSDFAGPTGRGRFYVPCPILATSATDMRVPVSNRDTFATAWQAFVVGVNTALEANTPGLHVIIASGGSLLKNLPPASHRVTEVGVGRVMDVMRSRRNALAEETAYLPV